MKQLVFLLFLLPVSFPTAFPVTNEDLPAAGSQTSPAQVELPMRLIDGMPAVYVFVNGQGPFLFRIDTGGAGQARVDSAVAEKLNLPKIGEIQGSAGGTGGSVAMPLLKLESLKLGPIEFKDVEAPSRNYNERGGERIDGILGFNLFADYLMTLDYPGGKLKLQRGELPAPDGKKILPFEMPNRIPVIKVDLAGTVVDARLDSGNMAAGFMLSQQQIEALKLSGEPRVVGRGRTISGDFEIKEVAMTGEIRIGAYRFPNPPVRFSPVFRDVNVGAAVLREFAVTFDQKNQRMKWERANEVVTLQQIASTRPTPTVVPLSAADAAAYVGSYGARTITITDGQLFTQKTGGPKLKILKVGEDEFGVDGIPEARIKFTKDASGKVIEMKVRNPAGEWESAPKSN